jgi:hypothetical protein
MDLLRHESAQLHTGVQPFLALSDYEGYPHLGEDERPHALNRGEFE